ncbi:MAG: Foldase protein PrsA [Candidatus Levybacteria bacterium GW2011_GWA2_40_16]|nr:MAG: Foldase protein PrsA [Candidatus Levybacteria bacterium GW2011_GWA2_40_16]
MVEKTEKTKKPTRNLKKFLRLSFFKNLKGKNILLVILLIIVIVLIGLLKNQLVVATVNGKQINRTKVIRELEKKEGKKILDSIITEELIALAAEKRKIGVSKQEIEDEFKKIEKSVSAQGQNLDQLLLVQNFSREQLRKQIRIQLILKKMVNPNDIKVQDREIEDYIEKNKESIPENAKMDQVKKQAREQLAQQKLNQNIEKLIQELQQKAKIQYFFNFN